MRTRTVVGILCVIGVVFALAVPASAATIGHKGDGVPDLYLGVDPATGADVASAAWLDLDGLTVDANGKSNKGLLNGFNLASPGLKIWIDDPDQTTVMLPANAAFTQTTPDLIFWSTFSKPWGGSKAQGSTGEPVPFDLGPAVAASWTSYTAAQKDQIKNDLALTCTHQYWDADAKAVKGVPGEFPVDLILPGGVGPTLPVVVPPTNNPVWNNGDVQWHWNETLSLDFNAGAKATEAWALVGDGHGAGINDQGVFTWWPNLNANHTGAPPYNFQVQVTVDGVASDPLSFDVTVVPEPGTIVMLLSGALLGLALWRRRRS